MHTYTHKLQKLTQRLDHTVADISVGGFGK